MNNCKRNRHRGVVGRGEENTAKPDRWERNFMLAVLTGVLFFTGLVLYAAWRF